MDRLEKTEGNKRLFWEFDLRGRSLTVRHGTVGGANQEKTNTFETPDAARRLYDQLVSFQTSQGFLRARPPDIRVALEQMIVADPDDKDAWLVHADQLMAQGDMRGELVAASARGEKTAGLLRKHAKLLLGPFASGGEMRRDVRLTWSMGYWERAEILCSAASSLSAAVERAETVLAALLAHPSSRFLRELRVGISCKPRSRADEAWDADWQSIIDALISAGSRPLRALSIGACEGDEETHGESRLRWRIGKVGGLWSAFPKLRRLSLQGQGISLGDIKAEHLESLTIWGSGLDEDNLSALASAHLPALSHLDLTSRNEIGYEASLGGFFEQSSLPALRALGIADCGRELFEILVGLPLLKQLSSLDLSYGRLADGSVDRAISALGHLEHLDVRRNYLSTAVVGRLTARLPGVDAVGQRVGGPPPPGALWDEEEEEEDEDWYESSYE